MKFLVFQHVENEPPGLISTWAKEAGVELEILELWKEYSIPDIFKFDGLVIMGGPMGVYENFPSEKEEIETIKKALGKVPIIGFCLGCQLLAHALGAKVYPNLKDGKKLKEIGYLSVDLSDEGSKDPLYKGFSSPIKVLQWHGDAYDLPEGGILLASSKDCTNQAFRYGKNAYGMLFHNEFTPEGINKQLEVDREWIHDGYEIDEEGLKKQALENAKLMKEQCRRLFDNFLAIIKNR